MRWEFIFAKLMILQEVHFTTSSCSRKYNTFMLSSFKGMVNKKLATVANSAIIKKSAFESSEEGTSPSKSSTFTLLKSISHNMHKASLWTQLQAGQYVVFVCTFDPKWEATFDLSLFSDKNVHLRALGDADAIVIEVAKKGHFFPFDLPLNLQLFVCKRTEFLAGAHCRRLHVICSLFSPSGFLANLFLCYLKESSIMAQQCAICINSDTKDDTNN